MHVQATLFEKHAVICGWGRRGTNQARWKIFPVKNRDQADELAQRIVNSKLKKGYRIINQVITS